RGATLREGAAFRIPPGHARAARRLVAGWARDADLRLRHRKPAAAAASSPAGRRTAACTMTADRPPTLFPRVKRSGFEQAILAASRAPERRHKASAGTP